MISNNMEVRILIDRLNIRQDKEGSKSIYIVPAEDGVTVLQALQFIYENLDPTLAFEYSCRYGRCGLCGVMVNNRSVLACTTFIRKEEINIKPLANLPVLRDLVIDREPLDTIIKKHKLYYAANEAVAKPGLYNTSPGFQTVRVPEGIIKLSKCLECLCCHSACTRLDPGEATLEDFAGPYIFLKLAQLHLDPRDQVDRKAQAFRLGLEKCLGCKGCYCPQGIAIYQEAIKPLLS